MTWEPCLNYPDIVTVHHTTHENKVYMAEHPPRCLYSREVRPSVDPHSCYQTLWVAPQMTPCYILGTWCTLYGLASPQEKHLLILHDLCVFFQWASFESGLPSPFGPNATPGDPIERVQELLKAQSRSHCQAECSERGWCQRLRGRTWDRPPPELATRVPVPRAPAGTPTTPREKCSGCVVFFPFRTKRTWLVPEG